MLGAAGGNQAASLLYSTQLEESFVLLDSRARRAPLQGATASAAAGEDSRTSPWHALQLDEGACSHRHGRFMLLTCI